MHLFTHSFVPFKQNLIWPYVCMPLKDKQGIIKKTKKSYCLAISQLQLSDVTTALIYTQLNQGCICTIQF